MEPDRPPNRSPDQKDLEPGMASYTPSIETEESKTNEMAIEKNMPSDLKQIDSKQKDTGMLGTELTHRIEIGSNVFIKVEFEEIEDAEAEAPENNLAMTIKPEPVDDSETSQSEEEMVLPDMYVKMEPGDLIDAVDDDNDDILKKKVKKSEMVDEYDGDALMADDIVKYIDTVTISDEELVIEYQKLLAKRKHMRFLCEPCAVGYVVEEAYLDHMKAHSPEAGTFVCSTCTRRFKSDHSLYMHELRHSRRYKCSICGVCYREKTAAASHIMANHRKRALTCKICQRRFRRPAYLKKHMEQMHTKTNRIQCEYCPRVFYERSWYRSHLRTHNTQVKQNATVRHPCEICAKPFRRTMDLDDHKKGHTGNACEVCKLTFSDLEALKQHYVDVDHTKIIVRKPNKVKSVCPVCGKECNTVGILRKHMKRMHTELRNKQFQCDYCKRFYYTKPEVRSHILWSHMRSTVRWHECSCGRQFRTPARARQHAERDHLNIVPDRSHVCKECGKGFFTKQILTRHMKSHSGETFKCPECPESFKSQSYVKIHHKMKHLNMTRAQIREENKQKRIKEMKDTQMIYGTNVQKPSKRAKAENKGDPLYLGKGSGKTKVSRDFIIIDDDDDEDETVCEVKDDEASVSALSAPRFDSFADVIRE